MTKKINRKKKSYNRNNGQAMIVSVVLIGGILLSASAVAGLLVVYQIRQSNDMVNSAKAFFAADTGIEAVSMCYFKGCDDPATPVVEDATMPPQILFSNGARWETTSTIIAATPTTSSTLNIIAKGFSGNTIRILETQFEQ